MMNIDQDIARKEATVLELAERLTLGTGAKLRYDTPDDQPNLLVLHVEEGGVVAFRLGVDLHGLSAGDPSCKRVLLISMITSLVCMAADRARELHRVTVDDLRRGALANPHPPLPAS